MQSNQQSSGWHLAQINIERIRAPLDDPSMAWFADNLTRINQLGAAHPGFVWQLLTEEGDSTGVHVCEALQHRGDACQSAAVLNGRIKS